MRLSGHQVVEGRAERLLVVQERRVVRQVGRVGQTARSGDPGGEELASVPLGALLGLAERRASSGSLPAQLLDVRPRVAVPEAVTNAPRNMDEFPCRDRTVSPAISYESSPSIT